MLQKVREYVENGWSTSRLHLPSDVVPYHSIQSEISYQDGLLFKSGRIVVPEVLQEDMLKRLHSSHLGIEGCLRRAREILYWPKTFVFENRTYLITVDSYSNFLDVDYLTSTTATAVIKKSKEQFSRHGIPETVLTVLTDR